MLPMPLSASSVRLEPAALTKNRPAVQSPQSSVQRMSKCDSLAISCSVSRIYDCEISEYEKVRENPDCKPDFLKPPALPASFSLCHPVTRFSSGARTVVPAQQPTFPCLPTTIFRAPCAWRAIASISCVEWTRRGSAPMRPAWLCRRGLWSGRLSHPPSREIRFILRPGWSLGSPSGVRQWRRLVALRLLNRTPEHGNTRLWTAALQWAGGSPSLRDSPSLGFPGGPSTSPR
jgi:hypothetical protein